MTLMCSDASHLHCFFPPFTLAEVQLSTLLLYLSVSLHLSLSPSHLFAPLRYDEALPLYERRMANEEAQTAANTPRVRRV